jgi:4-amino-4-deoxy-L-arabinose transferase-like glycosyltransferase
MHLPTYNGPPVFPLRLGVYAPVALLIKMFGLSEIAIAAYPLVISMLGCVLAYALACSIVTPLAGLFVLALVAIAPIDIANASLLLPDAIAAFWANLAVAITWNALGRSNVRRACVLGLLSGVLFGVSWLCKESVVYLSPFIVILVVVAKAQTSRVGRLAILAAIAAGASGVLVIEMLFYKRLTGDFLFRLHATERNYVEAAVWFFDSSSPFFGWQHGGYVRALLQRLELL